MNTSPEPRNLLDTYGSPLYVYDAEIIKARYQELVNNIAWPKTRIHYACKANTNIEILKLLKSLGAGIETVSEGEVRAAKAAGFAPEDILFTCSNVTEAELKAVVAHGVTINADSLSQMEKLARISPDIAIGIRINQGIGAGHHDHVITGGPRSKFGIPLTQVGEARDLAKKLGITITGVHQHIGSNVLDEDIFIEAVRALLKTAETFPDLTYVDFGGGFGIPYRPGETRLDIPRLGARITEEFRTFCATYGKELSMRFEAGRYLVAESGTLLVTVTDIKKTPEHTFVGVDSGFNHLIRPAMYGAYHAIENITHPDTERAVVTIAGNVCESGDVFAEDREISMPIDGDVLAIRNAGAYGFTMASTYNSRPLPAEVLIEGETPRLIRERGELPF